MNTNSNEITAMQQRAVDLLAHACKPESPGRSYLTGIRQDIESTIEKGLSIRQIYKILKQAEFPGSLQLLANVVAEWKQNPLLNQVESPSAQAPLVQVDEPIPTAESSLPKPKSYLIKLESGWYRNGSRCGKPWAAKVIGDGIGTPDYRFASGCFHGSLKDGYLIFEARPGEIWANGQKDFRKPDQSDNTWYYITDDGKMERISEAEAGAFWLEQRQGKNHTEAFAEILAKR